MMESFLLQPILDVPIKFVGIFIDFYLIFLVRLKYLVFFQVVEFFSGKLEASGPSPYSSPFVLETIIRCSQTWPHHRLRVRFITFLFINTP